MLKSSQDKKKSRQHLNYNFIIMKDYKNIRIFIINLLKFYIQSITQSLAKKIWVNNLVNLVKTKLNHLPN